jgi:hypothetical protein
MSRWSHSCCEQCWRKREPAYEPVIVLSSPREKCCYCGHFTSAGIFVRDDPAKVQCGGVHEGESR